MVEMLRKLLPALLAAVVGSVLTLWAIGRDTPQTLPDPAHAASPVPANKPQNPTSAASPATQPELLTVTARSVSARLRLGGYAEARNTVRLAAQSPGRVTYIAGQEGDKVSTGQLVVALDDDAMRPEYRAAWSSLAAQMSAAQNAQTQLYHNLYGKPTSPMGGPAYDAYERMAVPFYNMAQSMFGQMMPGLGGGTGSPFGSSGPMMTQSQAQRNWPALNNARADYEQRLANLAEAQSRLDGLDARLRDRRAIAPGNAVIVRKYVRAGDVVQPGQPLVDLTDTNALDFRLEVPVSQAANLKTGEQVPVSISGQNIWAAITQIFPTADDTQRTVTVKLALPGGAPVAPGMYGVAWLPQPGGGSPSATSPAIPTSAVVYNGSLPVAYVMGPDGKAEMRILRLGDTQNDLIAVLSGLSPGEQVIAQPATGLRSGDSPGQQP